MKFKYKEQTKSGEVLEGVKESFDKFTLAKEIRSNGNIPLSIVLESDGKFSFSNILKFNIFSHVSLAEKIVFTKNLSGMLSAGLAITRALSVLQKQSTNRKLVEVLQSLNDEINGGGTLSSGMAKFPNVFSTLFIAMVRSGEEAGGLPKVLSEIGITLKKSYDLNKKIKGAMIYPSIIIATIVLIGILMMIYVVPTLTATFKDMGGELPASTKLVIWMSDMISQHILMIIIGFVLFVGIIIFLFKIKKVVWYFDYIIIRLPVLGTLIKEMNSARTTRTMSSLLSSGVDMSRALSITRDVVQNVHYKKVIEDCIIAIEKGIPMSVLFKENLHLYPVMVGEMIEVGEETGKLSQMLIDVATFYENEVDDKTKNLSTIIEPVLMVFIGGAVGFFAISMITPMYSVMDTIN